MQKWLLVVGALGLMTVAPAVQAASASDEQPIKGPDGQTLAILVQCNSCASASGTSKKCHGGAEEGYLDGQPCGKCMMTENFGARFAYPYDIHITGKLVDVQKQPVKSRFVKVFMANGWAIRTKTSDEGTYRLMLGATAERKSTTPLVIELGTRVDSPTDNKDNYAMFLLPDGYKACPAVPKPEPKKGKGKAKKS